MQIFLYIFSIQKQNLMSNLFLIKIFYYKNLSLFKGDYIYSFFISKNQYFLWFGKQTVYVVINRIVFIQDKNYIQNIIIPFPKIKIFYDLGNNYNKFLNNSIVSSTALFFIQIFCGSVSTSHNSAKILFVW